MQRNVRNAIRNVRAESVRVQSHPSCETVNNTWRAYGEFRCIATGHLYFIGRLHGATVAAIGCDIFVV